jgi:DNA-directed RNA polymerase alpha subunit
MITLQQFNDAVDIINQYKKQIQPPVSLIGFYSKKPLTLESDIWELQTSVRVHNFLRCFFGSGYDVKIKDIVNLTETDVKKVRNAGLKTWQEIDRIKSHFGY